MCGYDQFYKGHKNNWFQLVHYVCNKYDSLTKFWEDHDSNLSPRQVSNLLHSLKRDLTHDFECYWYDWIESAVHQNVSGGRLQFYHSLKEEYSYEPYLSLIKNTAHRKVFSQLRLSAHRLRVETGRHSNIPRDQRLCKSCGNTTAIEDELHFLFDCPALGFTREQLFNSLKLIYPCFDALSIEQKTKVIFSDPVTCIPSSRFLFEMYSARA